MASLPDVSLGTPAEQALAERDTREDTEAPRFVKVASEPEPEPEPEPAEAGTELVPTKELPAAELAGERMSAGERGLVLAQHWARQAAASAKGTTSRPGGINAIQPESFDQYRAHVKSRAWLPEGCDSWWLEWIPVAYYNTLGNFGIAAGYAWAWLFKRMLRFNIAVLVVATTVTLWICFE